MGNVSIFIQHHSLLELLKKTMELIVDLAQSPPFSYVQSTSIASSLGIKTVSRQTIRKENRSNQARERNTHKH